MDSGSFASLDWGAVALVALIAATLGWGRVFFLRQNRRDLDDLQEVLDSQGDEEEDEEEDEKIASNRGSNHHATGS